MKTSTELNRPTPPATSEQERPIAWLHTNDALTGGSSVRAAAFVDTGDTNHGRGADGSQDDLGRRISGEAATLLTALRDAEADLERGRWPYIRITVPDTNSHTNTDAKTKTKTKTKTSTSTSTSLDTDTDTDAKSTIERGYDCLPDWWPARRGVIATLPHTVRLEMARRAAHWRPNWAELLKEDIRRDGAPARLCQVEPELPHISTPHAHARVQIRLRVRVQIRTRLRARVRVAGAGVVAEPAS
ncbi:hypothetical protein [Streptomyces sp. NPDC048196]|uniref:hypothetical protein n=1 Tax=Streptomyces sp. NPDC048196 TaxID=3154712 RepID=UPI0033CDC047